MAAGGDDTETWAIAITPGHERWMPGADLAGAMRVERLAALRDSFARNGIPVRFDVVPGAGHAYAGVVEVFCRAAKAPHPNP